MSWASVTVAVLVGALPVGGALAHASDALTVAERTASAWWPNVRDVSGTRLAEIEVVGVAGRPLVDSVIIASLWPKRDVRDALQPGDSFSPVPIDRGTLDGGRASVDIDDAALLRAHTSSGGEVDIQLDLFTADGRTILFVESRRDATGRWTSGPGTSLATAAASRAADASAVSRFAVDPEQLMPADLPPDSVVKPLEPRDHHDQWGCSAWDASSNVTVPETVATLGAYRGVKADVTYTTQAATVSELGLQGPDGIWKVSGSMTRSSTLTADYNQVVGSSTVWSNKEYRAGWVHHRYWAHCPLWENGVYTGKYYTQRITEPYKVASFPAIIDSRYSLPGCVYKHPLSGVASVTTETRTATWYGAAFKISYGGASFSGSARSDYSVNMKIKFSRPTGATYWYWCGDAYTPQDSYRVRAGR